MNLDYLFRSAPGVIISIVIVVLIMSVIFRYLGVMRDLVVIRMIPKMVRNMNAALTPPLFTGLRGKTKEQKKVIRYFSKIGIIEMILIIFFRIIWLIYYIICLLLNIRFFRKMSNTDFDNLINSKADEFASGIENRALEAHGMDADEAKEISPILAENYYGGSRYSKTFRDGTFRASEYQMTYLMFSDKQMYAYSYIFDLTSANTTEQTKEYFYKDITNVEVIKKQIEFPAPRPWEYILGGIACLIVGWVILFVGMYNELTMNVLVGYRIFSILFMVVGYFILAFVGFSRHLVENLILRLTVSGDEFECAMKPENIEAIQGMKAKIREKKSNLL